MRIIKKIKHRVAALVMSFFLALGLITPAFNISVKAEALEVANSACTVADMILSYCASGGVAILNETVIDEVYNVFGSSFGTLQTFVDNGLLTYSNGQYVDSGLATTIESAISNVSSIDIGAIFNQTAEQNPTGIALTGAGTIAGIAGSVATTGVLPVVAGVAVTGYCGFQIGTIIANMLGLYGKTITVGGYITDADLIERYVPDGGGYTRNNRYIYTCNIPIVNCVYNSGTSYKCYIYGYDGTVGNSYILNKWNIISGSANATTYKFFTKAQELKYESVNSSDPNNLYLPCRVFNSESAINSYWYQYNYNNGSKPAITSPDMIGKNGNLSGQYSNGGYTVPDMLPSIDENENAVNPTGITFDDWIRYANQAKANTQNGTETENQGIFNDIINSIKTNIPVVPDPEPDPNPDPNPNPDPETVPVPDVNPYPDTYPVPDPDTVPVNKEQPQYTEKATENETDISEGDPYTTPDLLDKFPFCIPRDILRAFKKLDSGSREAPHIQWRFHPNEMIDYTFDLDFSTWNNVATLLRLLELIAFIVLLGIATRNLILS